MKQLALPLYTPTCVAPERAVLSVLGATLRVARDALYDEHPALDHAPVLDEAHAPLVVAVAKLVADRCAELAALVDLYDAAVDHTLRQDSDGDGIPF
jgi:hypothetical protein